MLPVLLHCPICEERDPRAALFVDPHRVEVGPTGRTEQTTTCLQGHEGARVLIGVFEFDDRNQLVRLVDGLGLKYTRDVFERLAPLTKKTAKRVSKADEADKPRKGLLLPVTTAMLLLMGVRFEMAEANEEVEQLIAEHEAQVRDRNNHSLHHGEQHSEFRNVYTELRSAGDWQLRAAKRYHRASVVLMIHWRPEGDGTLGDRDSQEWEESRVGFNEACALVNRLITELKLRTL